MGGFVFGIVLLSTSLLVKLVNCRWTMKFKVEKCNSILMMVGNGRKIYKWQEIKVCSQVGVCIFECHNVIIGQHTMKNTIRDSKIWSKVNHL
jgi:hypothetical protein